MIFVLSKLMCFNGRRQIYQPIPGAWTRILGEIAYNGIRNHNDLSLQRVRKQLPNLTEIELPGLSIDHTKVVVTRESGFSNWQMAMDVFGAHLNPGDDYGDFWYTLKTDVLLNYWCRDYEESLNIHIENGGYLPPYRKQFVVVQKTYIEYWVWIRMILHGKLTITIW